MGTTDKSTLYSLQVGRAIAALAVVLHHATVAVQTSFTEYPAWLLNTSFLGYLGVEYFFVLSGFIIAHIAQTMSPSVREARKYAYSRFVRIFVPYLPVSLALLMVFLLAPALSHGAAGQFSYIGSLFLLPSNSPPALSVAWTLQQEIIFYTLFGISYFVLGNIRYLYLWVIPIVAASFVPVPQWLYILVAPINLEFLLGVTAYYAYKSTRFFGLRHLCIAIGVLVFILTCDLLYDRVVSSYRFLAAIGFSGVVLGLALMERTYDFSRLRVLSYLGAASYSLYLIHGPVISLLSRGEWFHKNWLASLLAALAASIAAGIVYYMLIEKPALARLKLRYRNHHRPTG